MSNQNNLEALEARLAEIEDEREAILKLISIWKGQPQQVGKSGSTTKVNSGSASIRGRVIDAVIELIHKNQRQVTNDEILNYIEEKQLSLGGGKNKVSGLGAILSQECEKKSARIRRVTRGVYDLK